MGEGEDGEVDLGSGVTEREWAGETNEDVDCNGGRERGIYFIDGLERKLKCL